MTGLRAHKWFILPENQTPSDTSDAPESHQRSATKSALPLATDVVRLPSHALRNVGVGTCTGEEDSGILGSYVSGPAHHGQADDRQDGVPNDHRSTDVVSIPDPCCAEHYNAGECVYGAVSESSTEISSS